MYLHQIIPAIDQHQPVPYIPQADPRPLTGCLAAVKIVPDAYYHVSASSLTEQSYGDGFSAFINTVFNGILKKGL